MLSTLFTLQRVGEPWQSTLKREQRTNDTHSPRWAFGFQKLAHEACAARFVKFPGHPADDASKDIWDFLGKRLRP